MKALHDNNLETKIAQTKSMSIFVYSMKYSRWPPFYRNSHKSGSRADRTITFVSKVGFGGQGFQF